ECAYPSCYSTCSFYTPRHDLHCRRFEHGIERLDHHSAHLTRIKFRRWAKLEGEGRVSLISGGGGAALDLFDRGYDRLSQMSSLGRRLNWRWNDVKRFVAGKGSGIADGDVFVFEAFHDDAASWPFTLSIMPKDKEKQGLFQFRIELSRGYNRTVIPVSEIRAKVGLDQTLVFQIEPLKERTPAIVFGVTDFVRPSRRLDNVAGRPPVQTRLAPVGEKPKFKCVVWDLDNTLWQGILAEDGIEGVRLSQTAARLVREFDRRGIINSIASKNDPELAVAALRKFGLSDYFVFSQIGWGPKSEGIRTIIADMDVGADTFAFIDDQAFERGEISELLPEVTVFADSEMEQLLDNPRFDVPITAESGNRREMYRTEERRKAARVASTVNYTDFLRACRIRLDIHGLTAANLGRIYELGQRTNQLNFSALRYSRADLERLMADPAMDTFVLACNDKFGDYGIIGFAVLNKEQALIESFFMSCRVQRKRVENAFFQYLAKELGAKGKSSLHVRYRKTAKNNASVQMLKELGFAYAPASEDEGVFSIALPPVFADDDVVEVALMRDSPPTQAVA
ncbi:MAG TPA: HAD-IIIC family phosphatase, partial [Rhizomicrobium sp.]|nr:HAD-IIIC family phosphatase [Rhizomicrobium sp.]